MRYNFSQKIYFVVGVGTDIGKTFFVEKICRDFVENGKKISVIKPIASGFKDDDKNSDFARILTALKRDLSPENIAKTSPWRFEEALSPHFAAKNCAKEIDFSEVKQFCLKEIDAAKKSDSFLLIEAAGGIMTPINFTKTFLDLAAELKIPLLLLSANYLGAISHTLCAVEAIKNRGIVIEAIIVNDSLPLVEGKSITESVKGFAGIKTVNLSEF